MYKVIDNFFDDPHFVRKTAIDLLANNHSCILNDSVRSYPGIRSDVPKDIFNFLFGFLKGKYDNKLQKFNCKFHITSGSHRLGLVHFDQTKYAGLIYLNEDPPKNSGTILCNPLLDKDLNLEYSFPLASTTHDIEIITEFANYKQNYNQNFEIVSEMENKFNRLVIYEGTQYHAPYYYFGNNLFNSRLVLVFWFDLD